MRGALKTALCKQAVYWWPVLILTLLLFLLSNQAQATPKGWQWYNAPAPLVQQHKKTKRVTWHQLDAKTQVAVLHYLTMNAIDQAILNPTNDNVKQAIIWQNFWSNHASAFTLGWQRAMLKNPELDYTVTHPTENNTAKIHLAIEREQENQAIQHFAKTDGLFFFYRGKAPLDQAFSKVVETFIEAHRIALIGVSLDGVLLPGMAHNFADHGQAKALGVKAYPALILVNPKTHQTQPIHYGFASLNELSKAFLNVATNFKGNF